MTSDRPSRVGLILLFTLAALFAFGWVTDTIRLPGERNVYTAECAPGSWDGNHCFGRLVAGREYRFQALEARGEVLFWTDGAPTLAGKYSDCSVKDQENWSCRPNAQTRSIIAHQ